MTINTELAEASALLDQMKVPTNRDEPGDPCDSTMTLAERIAWLSKRPADLGEFQ